MPTDHQNERPLGHWAEQQKKGMENQEQSQLTSEKRPALSDEEQQKLEADVARDTEREAQKADLQEKLPNNGIINPE